MILFVLTVCSGFSLSSSGKRKKLLRLLLLVFFGGSVPSFGWSNNLLFNNKRVHNMAHFVIRIVFGNGDITETIRHTQDGVQNVIDHIFADMGKISVCGGITEWTVTKVKP
jgi:hypothetical protein